MSGGSSGRSRWLPSRWCSCRSTCRNPPGYAKLPTASTTSSPPAASRCSMTTAMPAPASSSPTRSCSASRIGWWSAIGAWRPAAWSTAIAAIPRARSSRPTKLWHSSRHACGASGWLIALAALIAASLLASPAARADQQRDPALGPVVQRAIGQAQCFADRFDAAVWYTMMEPRLERFVHDPAERLKILRQVYCETHRTGESKLPPGLVMAVIEVESDFNRWAVSSAGAVGLMQVMPYWPVRLGLKRYEL